jgi:hypothetical protein
MKKAIFFLLVLLISTISNFSLANRCKPVGYFIPSHTIFVNLFNYALYQYKKISFLIAE